MKAPVSWIKEYVDVPTDVTTDELTRRLTMTGLKLEAIESPGAAITGPLVVGQVLTQDKEPQKNGKVINWCTVDVGDANGTGEPQGIVCGAHNFGPGDKVVVVLPGGVLPGGFAISERKTYGHLSAGMICSHSELGLAADPFGSDGEGIIVLPADAGEPGQDVRSILGLDEEVIEFEVNPDRAYGLSLRGIARDVLVSVEGASNFRDPAVRETPVANDAGYPVVLEDTVGCPVFVARKVTGFDPSAPTPSYIADRLTAAGMRSISLAVDVTNYVMLETGRPIHGYDADKLQGPIVVRRAQAGEKLTTLDGTERTLHPEDLVVTDDSGIIGLGGVMGGTTTEMSETTTSILVESAHWDAVSMFRTGKRHKISSEAGKRNERGVDPTICEAAADRVVELLVEHGGATVDPGVTVVGTPPAMPTIIVAADLAARVAGMEISEETAVEALRAVGCEVSSDGAGTLTVVPPPWRPDMTDPQDTTEEVIRLVGYDKVPSVLPVPPAGRGLTREQRLRRRLSRAAAAEGYTEVVTFPFVGDADFELLGIGADDERRNALRLANPLSTEAPFMTTTVLPGLLRTAARNVGHGATSFGLFETATVTLPTGGVAPILPVDRAPSDEEFAALQAALPRQPLRLGLVAVGEVDASGWWGAGRAVTWADAVDAVRGVADQLGLVVDARNTERAPWHPGRCAELGVAGTVVGHAGELHPKVCAALGLPRGSVAAEVDLDLLMERGVDLRPASVVSTQPLAKEDVALVVDADVPAAEVEAALRDGAGEALESIRLFDVYTGDQIDEGKKSLAFALRFRAADRTLTEKETSAFRAAAVAAAAEKVGAVQR